MRRNIHVRRLLRDRDGATLVEFALIAPALILILMGTFDLGHMMYTTSVLQGTLQKSARQATLESGFSDLNNIDERIEKAVTTVMPVGEVTITRRNFQNFADITTPEEHIDGNGDNFCNNGEKFEDLNNNNRWDRDRGRDGIGGARDAVVFTATVNYDRMFPLAGLVAGIDKEVEITAETVLRNQPYDNQTSRTPTEGTCP